MAAPAFDLSTPEAEAEADTSEFEASLVYKVGQGYAERPSLKIITPSPNKNCKQTKIKTNKTENKTKMQCPPQNQNKQKKKNRININEYMNKGTELVPG